MPYYGLGGVRRQKREVLEPDSLIRFIVLPYGGGVQTVTVADVYADSIALIVLEALRDVVATRRPAREADGSLSVHIDYDMTDLLARFRVANASRLRRDDTIEVGGETAALDNRQGLLIHALETLLYPSTRTLEDIRVLDGGLPSMTVRIETRPTDGLETESDGVCD